MSARRFEVAARWTDAETGVQLRCKFDGIVGRIIVELKTTRNADPNSLQMEREFYRLGYHRKAALYIDAYTAVMGHPPDMFVFVFVENTKFPRVSVRKVDPNSVEVATGRREYRQAIREIMDRDKDDNWLEDWELEETWFSLERALPEWEMVG